MKVIKLEYEIGGGTSLIMEIRETYCDKDGSGKIDRPNETVKETRVSMGISFF